MRVTPHRVRIASAGLMAAGALLVLSACSSEGDVFNLEVGQCIDELSTTDEVGNVPIVECSEPHQGEVFALPQLPDGDFPGTQAVSDASSTECNGPTFQSYVGMPYTESDIYTTALLPTAETWEDGDREIVCILIQQDRSDSTGTLRGANR